MFLLKKLVSSLLFPVALSLEFLFLGLVLLWFTRRQRAGRVLVTAGAALLALFSNGVVGDLLMRPLESRYAALHDPRGPAPRVGDEREAIRWVLVLGGGHTSSPDLPLSARLTDSSLVRLIEGILLHRRLPGAKLILSGGVTSGEMSEARGMAELALALGVNARDLVLEGGSLDTEDQARFVRRIVGQDRLILVTSAAHMPRSMALFRKQGMRAVPAPTGHWTVGTGAITARDFLPSVSALKMGEQAVHEYLGFAWAKLRGKIF